MSERTLRNIVIALVGLIVVYAAVSLLGRGSGASADGGSLSTTLEQLSQDSAGTIGITSPEGSTIELALGQADWTVNGMPADSAAIQRLLSALRDARPASMVSRNADNHARLGVASDSAWQIEVQTDGDATQLLLGKSGTRSGTSYVRAPDEDATWEVEGDLRAAAARPLADWRDRVIVRVDTARVATLVIEREGAASTVARADSAWRVDDNMADSAAVAAVLAELARFEATAFAPDTATFDGSERRSVTALAAAGDTLARIEFAGREYIWRARRAGGPPLYDVPSYRVDRITPRKEDIRPSR